MTVQDYPCQIHHNVLSDEILERWGHLLPAAYDSAAPMALLAAAMADSTGSPLLALPFDCVAEAEALGARVTGYEDRYGLRVQGHICHDVVELAGISFDGFSENGRIRQILCAIAQGAAMGYVPCLNLSGFLSTADLLVSMEKVFLAWRSKKPILDSFFQRYTGLLIEYAFLAQQNGAKIISYSDPLAASGIVGPRLAAEISRDLVVPFLRRLLELPGGGIIQLCGKTSYALETAHSDGMVDMVDMVDVKDIVEIEEIPLKKPMAYQEAVAALAKQSTEKIILGHSCLNHNRMTDRLWRLNLLHNNQSFRSYR